MKLYDLKKMPTEELKRLIKDDREKLRQMRFDLAAGKVKDVSKIRQTKKDIARALTLLNSKPRENHG